MGSKKTQKKNKKIQAPVEAPYGSTKVITDERFASVHSDPRFQKVPKHKTKVAIDSRFQRMFSDKRFSSSSASLDKRGRPKKHDSENSLRHYYRMDEDDEEKGRGKPEEEQEEESEGTSESEETEDESRKKLQKVGGEESSESESEDEDSELDSKASSGTDNDSEEDTDTDTDTDEGENVDDDVRYEFRLQEENVPVIEKETHRLAAVNLDWRHVSAADLYVMLSSFLPKDGQIKSVAVYPSEFGLQRMKEEEVHGPVGLFDDENKKSDEDDDGEINNEKLRAYERSRLRYYYAVVECDSIATADYLYKSCDGVEFERSSNVLDLRFVPDSMEFKHPPRDVCTEAPTSYEGLSFETRALQHSNIQLTWDDDEPHRVKTLKRNFDADQLADMELKEFLASDESDGDDDENDDAMGDTSDKKKKKVEKYLALVQSGDGSDEDNEEAQDMEVTFNTGLEDLSKRILEKKDKKSETVWEAYLRKRREKKKARKNKSKYSSDDESSDTDQEPIDQPDDFFVEEPMAKKSKKEMQGKSSKAGKKHQDTDGEAEASTAELELLLADDNGADTEIKGYNIKSKKGKGKKRKELLDEEKIPTVNYSDPRFSALFTSPHFALDPTDPQYKRSAAYARQAVQKQQKTNREELRGKQYIEPSAQAELPSNVPEGNKEETSDVLPSKREKYELSSLVKSIKSKSRQVRLPSESKALKKVKKGHCGGKA